MLRTIFKRKVAIEPVTVTPQCKLVDLGDVDNLIRYGRTTAWITPINAQATPIAERRRARAHWAVGRLFIEHLSYEFFPSDVHVAALVVEFDLAECRRRVVTVANGSVHAGGSLRIQWDRDGVLVVGRKRD